MAAMTPEIASSSASLLISQHLNTSAVNQKEVEDATAELRALLGSLETKALLLPDAPPINISPFIQLRDFDGEDLLRWLDTMPDHAMSLQEILEYTTPFKAFSDEALASCSAWAGGNGGLGGEDDAEIARAFVGVEKSQREGKEKIEAIIRQYAARGWPLPVGAMLYSLSKSGEELRAQQIATSNAAAEMALSEALALFNQGLSTLSAALGDVYNSALAYARLGIARKNETQDTAKEYANAAATNAEAKLQAYRAALDVAKVAVKFPMRAHGAKLQAAETNAQAVIAMLERKIAVESMRLKALSDIAASSINGLSTRANVRVRTSLE